MTETGNKGHRKRLRDRFAGEEKDSCSEEALLELLLTYAIPRKDVQPLVKSLLVEFGTLMAVLQAPMKTLSKFNGLTDNSAALIKLVDWIRLNYGAERRTGNTPRSGTQASLFEATPSEKKKKTVSVKRGQRHEKVAVRRSSLKFTNALLKETIQLLPSLPDSESLDEIRSFLRAKLHFSAEQTRHRLPHGRRAQEPHRR